MHTINYKQLERTCRMSIESFFKDAKVDYRTNDYIYIDNGSDILGVAHLDTVMNTHDYNRVIVDRQEYIISSELDDRLGVFTLLHMLPEMGIKTDILLCCDEERMGSTASSFKTDKQYKWAYEFDRKLVNPVLYQYETPDLMAALKDSGYTIDNGSYSDIADLDIGVCGINFGVGYDAAHTQWCRANTSVYLECINRFAKFYRKNKDVTFLFTKPPKQKWQTEWYDGWQKSQATHLSRIRGVEGKTIICDVCHMKGSQWTIPYDSHFKKHLCDNCYNAEWYKEEKIRAINKTAAIVPVEKKGVGWLQCDYCGFIKEDVADYGKEYGGQMCEDCVSELNAAEDRGIEIKPNTRPSETSELQ